MGKNNSLKARANFVAKKKMQQMPNPESIKGILARMRERLSQINGINGLSNGAMVAGLKELMTNPNPSIQQIVDERSKLWQVVTARKAKLRLSELDEKEKQQLRISLGHADASLAALQSTIFSLKKSGLQIPRPKILPPPAEETGRATAGRETVLGNSRQRNGYVPSLWENNFTRTKGIAPEKVEGLFEEAWEKHIQACAQEKRTLFEREKKVFIFAVNAEKGIPGFALTMTEREVIHGFVNPQRNEMKLSESDLEIIEKASVRYNVFQMILNNKRYWSE